jgi:hypothetical protein
MMAVTKITSHYLQHLYITTEDNYNGTCMPLFNVVIIKKREREREKKNKKRTYA